VDHAERPETNSKVRGINFNRREMMKGEYKFA